MIISDSHLHTAFSTDSEAPMEAMVQKGIALGLSTMCFTEHNDYDIPAPFAETDFALDYESYFEAFETLREKYDGQIELLLGVEQGIQPHIKPWLDEFREKYIDRFDFLISSCHFVGGYDPYYPTIFEHMSVEEMLTLYFDTILQNIQVFPEFQTLGHIDYVYRYINPHIDFSYKDHGEVIDEILKILIDRGQSLEVNSAGLKAGLGYPHPHKTILLRYRELGGELITIGSDAHAPNQIAWEFHLLPDYLKSLGFQYYTLYKKKQPTMIKL